MHKEDDKIKRTEWFVNKMFTNRGWELVVKNGRNVLCKRF